MLPVRLPSGLPDARAAKPHLDSESIRFRKDKRDRGDVLEICLYYESGDLDELWDLGELLEQLIPLWSEILDGDLRPLYLAHLASNPKPYIRKTEQLVAERSTEAYSKVAKLLANLPALSWDQDAPFCVCLTGRRPAFRIFSEAQKSNRSQLLPMTPDFAQWLLETSEEERTGPVFTIIGLQSGKPITPKRISRIITRIGKKANVVVNREMRWVSEKLKDPKTGKETGEKRQSERKCPSMHRPTICGGHLGRDGLLGSNQPLYNCS